MQRAVDHANDVYMIAWPCSVSPILSSTTSDSNDKDSLVAGQPRKVASLVPDKGNV